MNGVHLPGQRKDDRGRREARCSKADRIDSYYT